MYIAYYSEWKTFGVSCLYLYSQKHVCSYQLLQTSIVFTCKNSPKHFCGCKVICKNCETFSPQITINIWYGKPFAVFTIFPSILNILHFVDWQYKSTSMLPQISFFLKSFAVYVYYTVTHSIQLAIKQSSYTDWI